MLVMGMTSAVVLAMCVKVARIRIDKVTNQTRTATGDDLRV